MPSRTTSSPRRPGPVEEDDADRIELGEPRTLAQSASTRCSGSSGPSISGSGRIDGTDGMQCVARNPLSRSCPRRVVAELELADADALDPRRAVRREVLLEASPSES